MNICWRLDLQRPIGLNVCGGVSRILSRLGCASLQAVCRLYNVPVTDFSTSFADGRVLCLLVLIFAQSVHSECFPVHNIAF